jgi:hypothetical protein
MPSFDGFSGTYSIPASVTSIGWIAFQNCTSLTSVTFAGNAPFGISGFTFDNAAPGFVIRYPISATGFTTPTWLGYPSLPSSVSGFATWASTAGLSGLAADPTAAPDKDGVPNLLEYAFATSPSLATAAAQLPFVTHETVAGQPALVLTHRRRKVGLGTFTYQQATNLAAANPWAPVSLTPTVVTPDADGDGQTELVFVALPLGTHPRLFLRLSVSE